MDKTSATNDPTLPGSAVLAVPDQASKLRGNLGVWQLLFTILAFNGPLAVMVGFAPVVVGYGNGIGAPSAYLLAGVMILLFTVGFTRMSRDVKNPGGFYSFISRGLGREVGLGASFLAVVCYYLLALGVYAFMGIALNPVVHETFNGPDIPWWIWALAGQAFVGFLCYFNLDVSAKVLTLLLAMEVVILFVYDAAVVFQGGAHGLSVEPFMPDNAFSGAIGLALLFAVMGMGGFEVTVVFRDEVRNPSRTIPLAAYGFTLVVAVLFGLTTWAIIEALGEGDAVALAAADPTGSFLDTMQTFVGTFGVDLVNVLMNTSILAGVIATQNVLSRYVFNLGVDGILPKSMGTAHARHGSPARSSVACAIAILIGFLPFVIAGADPTMLYAQLTGGFGYALIMLILITTVAVLAHFNLSAERRAAVPLWHRLIAPILATVGFAFTLFMATKNIDILITQGTWLVAVMMTVLYGALIVGFVYARYLKRAKPDVYARIGRR